MEGLNMKPAEGILQTSEYNGQVFPSPQPALHYMLHSRPVVGNQPAGR